MVDTAKVKMSNHGRATSKSECFHSTHVWLVNGPGMVPMVPHLLVTEDAIVLIKQQIKQLNPVATLEHNRPLNDTSCYSMFTNER